MKLRILFLSIFGTFVFNSCSSSENDTNTDELPILTTYEASNITSSGCLTGGNISSDGGSDIIQKGVVWSNIQNPTIELNTKSNDGFGVGIFNSTIGNLNQGVTYFIRAYATNSSGTAYGNEVSFTTDAFQSITIGTQIWQNKNLDVTSYRDGTPIPQVTDPTQWENLTTGAWCYFNNDTSNGVKYGKLYNWYAVAGIHDNNPNTPYKVLAPIGWHIPSDDEWTSLTNYLGGENISGGKLKESGTTHWTNPNTGATNSSGFSGLPGGQGSYSSQAPTMNIWTNNGEVAVWWSSTESSYPSAWSRILRTWYNYTQRLNNGKNNFCSVRCIKY